MLRLYIVLALIVVPLALAGAAYARYSHHRYMHHRYDPDPDSAMRFELRHSGNAISQR